MTVTLAVRESLRGPTLRERALLVPEALDTGDAVWWGGNDLGTGTTLTITGSQTITEAAPFSADPKLSVTAISGISTSDMNCVLFPRTIAVGQIWRCRVRLKGTSNVFAMAMFGFSDGTIGTSNVVTAFRYINSTSTNMLAAAWHGTLTNLATGVGDTVYAQTTTPIGANPVDSTVITEIEYTSANTFAVRYRDPSLALLLAITGVAVTMTPTHIAVGWSSWGAAGSTREVHFGPVYRVA